MVEPPPPFNTAEYCDTVSESAKSVQPTAHHSVDTYDPCTFLRNGTQHAIINRLLGNQCAAFPLI